MGVGMPERKVTILMSEIETTWISHELCLNTQAVTHCCLLYCVTVKITAISGTRRVRDEGMCPDLCMG